MKRFNLAPKKRAYFEGCYFKQQGEKDSIALIPAFHIDSKGERNASLQIITSTQSHFIRFPANACHAYKNRLCIRLGDSVFSERGCKLSIDTPDLSACGILRYENLTPLHYDIMGPFCAVPALQCRHSICSLRHKVNGALTINGQAFTFHNAVGYIEGDRGTSFPQKYIWTQCSRQNDCIMLSVADIPLGPAHFTGCIAAVLINGRQYRLATYLGAKILHHSKYSVLIRQGSFFLEARLLYQAPQSLAAPQSGRMERTIQESLCSTVQYKFTKDNVILLQFTSKNASFESV